MPRPLYQRYSLDTGLGEPQNRGEGRKEKNHLQLLGMESQFVGGPVRSPSLYPLSYAIPTELFRGCNFARS
jgi:hypothetical protein